MASDNEYDIFDYNSSQDPFEIDYQIDLFEFRRCLKSRKSKPKLKKSSCPISLKTLKSQRTLVKVNCMNDKITRKAEQKSFRYDRYSQKSKIFECDEVFQENSTILSNSISTNSSKQQIFYHGTRLKNIESILQYGFLIPNRAHPSNSEAPIIVSEHGRAFGTGIYSSYSAAYSLLYINATNTFLACAAIPKRDKVGKIERFHGNILVLSHVSQIIPLFLMDFKYLNGLCRNYPCFNEEKQGKIDKNNDIKKPVIISRKYLRKVLNYMNDEVRKNNRYQVRSFEFFN
ncbi:unnamed protein product [Rotaria sordida]|uniref:PARP catalytic domain-containing protein n=1 Tax=Rotaria sordida TaxID=392033 RepID=A0A814SBU3_9BILA|nr:unnamed protein product [Rotaria sordida]CAF4017788.1 unnamed protein product [Rotaria sordida]